jgi:hypothetical protein
MAEYMIQSSMLARVCIAVENLEIFSMDCTVIILLLCGLIIYNTLVMISMLFYSVLI